MVATRLVIPSDELAAFCRRHRILRLSLFGSVLRDDFGPESDVDVLVDYEPGERSFAEILDAKDELSALLGGREVDLISRPLLNRWVRERVFAEEEVVYDRDRGAVGFNDEAADERRGRRPSVTERDALYFGQMLDHARRAIRLAVGVDRDRFDEDETLRLALTHLVQIVGEAARKVSAESRALHPDIPWKHIIGMRHILVHEYDAVEEPKVWETVDDDLPHLVSLLEAIVPVEPTE